MDKVDLSWGFVIVGAECVLVRMRLQVGATECLVSCVLRHDDARGSW